MSDNPEFNPTRNQKLEYLKELRANLTFGRCAGKVTELTKLHQNRLASEDVRGRSLWLLYENCRIIQEANFYEAHMNKPIVPEIGGILRKIVKFLDDGVLEPYRYAVVFDIETESYHEDEDGNIIYPTITEKERRDFAEWYSRKREVLFENVDIGTLEKIQQAATTIRDHIFNRRNTIQNHNTIQLTAQSKELDTQIDEAKQRLDKAQVDRDKYTEFLKSSPIEFGEEESKVLNAKMDELDSNVSNWFSMLNKLRSQKEMTKRKIEQERAKFALDMTIPVKSFLAMMDENNSEIFGDIPEFYSAIKDSESNVSAELKQFKEGGLVSIFGDPGFGKTIQLRQFTHKLISKQINSKKFNFIPIFVKAKSLAKVIKSIPDEKQKIPMKNVPFNPFSKDAAIERAKERSRRRGAQLKPEPEDVPFNPFAKDAAKHVRVRLKQGRENGDFEDLSYLREAILESEPDMQEVIVSNLFDNMRLQWKRIYLIVDAYDEILSEDDRVLVAKFIRKRIESQHCKAVITCRNSHKDEFVKHVSSEKSHVPHVMMDIHFTKQELRYEMPTKLANAWGINSDQLAHSAMVQFKDYEAVLTHPLFVGFFCMLLEANALTPLEEYKKRIHLDGPISLQHVIFLRKVIEFGLGPTIKERSEVTESEMEKIKRVFFFIASTYLTTNLTNMVHILSFIKKYHNIELTSKEKTILNEHLGVMFVNGEREIEWTHKTLPEVAAGLIIKDDEDYKQFLRKNYGSVFGNKGALWSECLLMTVIQDDLEELNEAEPFQTLKTLFPTMGKQALKRTLDMFGVEDKNYITNIRKIEQFYHFSPTGDEGIKPLMKALGEAFFDSLRGGNPFPIPNAILGKSIKKELHIDLFKRTNLEGEPYSDVVFEPKKLSFPNFPVAEIFDRFENNVEKLSYFYLIRKAYGNQSIHPNPRLDTEFVERLISMIEEQATTLQLNFDKNQDWVAMLLGCFKSKASVDLMQTICSTIRNNVSSLDLNDVDHASLERINSTILKKVRTMPGSSQQFRQKFTAKRLKTYRPQILRQLIGCILTFDRGIVLARYGKQYTIPEEYEEQFATIREAWGLPDTR
ncbi:MAG TPA: hypothetical protein D7I06_02700, partial [Candidatus Poseidoniales archaeon]